MSRITKFWFVTAPTADSTLQDIMGDCDVNGFIRQVRGGLSEKDNVALFATQAGAFIEAQTRLEKRDASPLMVERARELVEELLTYLSDWDDDTQKTYRKARDFLAATKHDGF